MGKITLLLFLVLLAFTAQPSFAAFPVKQTVIVAPSAATAHTSLAHRFIHRSADTTPDKPAKKTKGICGTLSLVFGIISFIPVLGLIIGCPAGVMTILAVSGILFGHAAIVLGAFGMHNHEKHAQAGVILGIFGVITDLIILIAAITAAAGSISLNVM